MRRNKAKGRRREAADRLSREYSGAIAGMGNPAAVRQQSLRADEARTELRSRGSEGSDARMRLEPSRNELGR